MGARLRLSLLTFGQGSSLFASRSNCEPTQLPWESSFGSALVVAPADTHLFHQVLRPSGTGRLGPLFIGAAARRCAPMRKALNENPVVQVALIGVLGVVVGFLLITRIAGQGGCERRGGAAGDRGSRDVGRADDRHRLARDRRRRAADRHRRPRRPRRPPPAPASSSPAPACRRTVVDAYERRTRPSSC